jgi:two-component system response regulator YesN
MKILIVDDEPIMLDAICKILEKEERIRVDTARTGREAIEKAESFLPELIMMDIKMPGINGLEALAEIRRITPQAISIIVTAYDNFNFAHEALRLHVFDYLLKPVTKTRLLETIAKVQRHLDEMRALRHEELTLRERYNKLLPLIESEFLQALQKGVDPLSFCEYQEMLGIEFNAGFFMVVFAAERPEESELQPQYLLREKLTGLTKQLKDRFNCLVSPAWNNPLPIFIPGSSGDKASPSQESISEKILDFFTENLPRTDIRIGVGAVHPSPSGSSRSYQEALQALNRHSSHPLDFYGESAGQPDSFNSNDLELEMRELSEAIRFGHVCRVESLCAKLTAKHGDCTGPYKERLLYYLLELLLGSIRACRELAKDRMEEPALQPILAMVDERLELGEIFPKISATLIELTRLIRESRQTQVNTVILRAKEMVDRLYHQELSLEELARAVAVSPFYLSRLFREELGVCFSEYLTRLRLEKGMALLAGGLSVKECSFAVGYNDPNYFSRIFRKYYHQTPTEYRDQVLQGKELPT